MGDGKWETNGVKVNHPTPRLGFDAFESRSTLADPRPALADAWTIPRHLILLYVSTKSDPRSQDAVQQMTPAFREIPVIRDQRQPNGRKTGANSFLYVELPRPFYISSWDKCQTFSFTCRAQQLSGTPVFQKGKEILTFG